MASGSSSDSGRPAGSSRTSRAVSSRPPEVGDDDVAHRHAGLGRHEEHVGAVLELGRAGHRDGRTGVPVEDRAPDLVEQPGIGAVTPDHDDRRGRAVGGPTDEARLAPGLEVGERELIDRDPEVATAHPRPSAASGVAFGVPMTRLTIADIAHPSPTAPRMDASGPTAAITAPNSARSWTACTDPPRRAHQVGRRR